MGMGRRNYRIELSANDREQLESIQRSRALPHSLVRRARIVLLSADGVPVGEIARLCQVSRPTVTQWRRRFVEQGLVGLHAQRSLACRSLGSPRTSPSKLPGSPGGLFP